MDSWCSARLEAPLEKGAIEGLITREIKSGIICFDRLVTMIFIVIVTLWGLRKQLKPAMEY